MDTNEPASPVKRKLTQEMKDFIRSILSGGENTTATRLFTLICTMVAHNEIAGPAPRDSQVSDFVKNWRRTNPKDSMVPMILLCEGRLYDQLDFATLGDREMIILCDSQQVLEPGSSDIVPHLGDGSNLYPLRIGMTCAHLVRNYIAVQNRPECTTILHIDSTHSMVINGYLVFALGYSDKSGSFFPMVYFCTSQKRSIDIDWCIRYVKRICFDLCGVHFSPQFVMMDADKAQYNACLVEQPITSILMCWFHVTQNVWKHSREKKVSDCDTKSIFEDLYDMHYASQHDFPAVKRRILLKWIQFPVGSSARKLTDHILKMWIRTERFSHWQTFYTPGGYTTTNNPLEQYHRKLKCQCPGPSNPSELIKIWMGRELHISTESDFKTVGNASERLMRLYRFMYKKGCFSVQRIPPVGSVAADLYRVKEHRLDLAAAEKRDFTNSIKSVNSRRMQTQGMPSGGWIIDTRSKSCSCLFFWKYSMCCHVVNACIAGGVACPGVSMRSRQFVRPNHADTAEYPDDFPDAESTGAEKMMPSHLVLSIASLASTESLPEDDYEYQVVPPTHTEVVLPQPQDGLNTDIVRPGSRRSLRKKKPRRRAIEPHLQRLKRMRR
ncbi:unnamed protein product [Phytophthora fragariaefolia]|uniref:Unnamed protein product n=1 Tax=Phytophthora fragariaefolia TaxID=1490495 RepID=A0A9W6X0X7_9STRA|nr:unnamed protein product [Phytophthora fragariaefolia]